MNINAADGIISEVKIFSDCLYPNIIEEVTNSLKGCTYDQVGIANGINQAASNLFGQEDTPAETTTYLNQLQEWLSESI